MEKTTVFNLVIIDESGSMSSARNSAISGCNETINVARHLQSEHPDTQRCLMSIYAFQKDAGVPSRYLCKNVPVANAKDITTADYRPLGNTPMLDAIGSTLTDLIAVASTHEDATAIVTIITDGFENSSCEYSWQDVARIINRVKEMGWTVNFIGANIDVDEVASRMNIDNRKRFTSDAEGTHEMFNDFANDMYQYEQARIQREMNMCACERRESRKSNSKDFFTK